MPVNSILIQNVPVGTQSIVFYNPSQFDSLNYTSLTMTYSVEAAIVLSKADFALWFANKLAFYNSLVANFPASIPSYNLPLPICKFEILSLATSIQFLQTSSASAITNVYNITYSKTADTATFTARSHPITISMQEFFTAFQFLSAFVQQCSLV